MKIRSGAIVAAVAFAVLVGLGLWQLDRRDSKHERLQAIEAGLAQAPRALRDAPTDGDAWTPVIAQGLWHTDGLIQIAPRTLDGKVGIDYAAPFILTNGDPLIVLLGWAPSGAAAPKLNSSRTSLQGILVPAPRPSLIMPDNIPPDQWIWLEPKAVAATSGLDAARTSNIALRMSDPPSGLTKRSARPNLPDNHLQYAFTWFSLAVALAGVAFFAGRRQDSPSSRNGTAASQKSHETTALPRP